MEPLGSTYLVAEEVIGRGAMGLVHVGERKITGEKVAVKVLRPELSEDPEIVGRFLQERSVLTGLNHPNLVRIHDLVVESGRAAVVMDLVEGRDLRHHLGAQKTLEPAEALRITAEVLDALAVVHAAGIVHRDVKPENVLLDASGAARLTDFGIAKIASGPTLTRLTGLVGTPEYLAPEGAENENAAAPVDVYAAGVMLYELLTGATPFAGGHPVAVLRRHMEEAPTRPPGISDQLWDLLSSMLEKEPLRRPSAGEAALSCRYLSAHLVGAPSLSLLGPEERGTVIKGTPIGEPLPPRAEHRRPRATRPAAPPLKTRRRAVVVGALAAVVVIAGAAGVVLARGGKAPRKPAAARHLSYAFPQTRLSTGLVVARTWTLTLARAPQLTERLTLTNAGHAALGGFFYDVIPNQLGASVTDFHFTATPAKIVAADPVVAYSLQGLGPGSALHEGFAVQIAHQTGSADARLTALVADQVAAQAAFRPPAVAPHLVRLVPNRRSLVLVTGKSARLTVSGIENTGARVAPAALRGLVWRSSRAAVATVSLGAVRAHAPGTAAILARVGSQVIAVRVRVQSAPKRAKSTVPPAKHAHPSSTAVPSSTLSSSSPPSTTRPAASPHRRAVRRKAPAKRIAHKSVRRPKATPKAHPHAPVRPKHPRPAAHPVHRTHHVATRPVAVSFLLASPDVNTGQRIGLHYSVANAPATAGVWLQQETPAGGWQSIERISVGDGAGNAAGTAPSVGDWVYRVAVIDNGTVLAVSRQHHLHSYGQIDGLALCGSQCAGRSTLGLNGQPVQYDLSDTKSLCSSYCGASQAPEQDTLARFANGTCSTINLQVAAVSADGGGATETAIVTVQRSDAAPQSITVGVGQTQSVTFRVSNQPYSILASGSAGAYVKVYVNLASAVCYTPNGVG